jgi:AcrR family transcriptional regulator
VPPRRIARPAARPRRVTPRRRVRLDNEARRAQLLALARQVFTERSYDEVSIDELAREAGISKGLFYHYFPTKRDLYVAGLRQIADDLVARATSVPADLAPVDRVRAGLDAYLGFVVSHSRAFVALLRGGVGSDPEVAAVIEDTRGAFFRRVLEDSPFAAQFFGSQRLRLALRGWIGFVEATSIDWCVQPILPQAELRDLLAGILIETLRIAVSQP